MPGSSRSPGSPVADAELTAAYGPALESFFALLRMNVSDGRPWTQDPARIPSGSTDGGNGYAATPGMAWGPQAHPSPQPR